MAGGISPVRSFVAGNTPVYSEGSAGPQYNPGQQGYNPYGVQQSQGSRTIRHDITGTKGAYYEENQDYDPQSQLWKTSNRSHTIDPNAINSIDGLMAGMSSGGGGAAGHVSYGGADADAARSASFARAKDKAGMIARSSLDSLASELNTRGVEGGGYQTMKTGEALGGVANSLGEFNRNQLEDEYQNQSHVNDQVYQGNIVQRGQDVNRINSLMAIMGRQGGTTLY